MIAVLGIWTQWSESPVTSFCFISALGPKFLGHLICIADHWLFFPREGHYYEHCVPVWSTEVVMALVKRITHKLLACVFAFALLPAQMALLPPSLPFPIVLSILQCPGEVSPLSLSCLWRLQKELIYQLYAFYTFQCLLSSDFKPNFGFMHRTVSVLKAVAMLHTHFSTAMHLDQKILTD